MMMIRMATEADDAGQGADLVAGDLGQGLALAPDGGHQDHKIMDRPGHDRPNSIQRSPGAYPNWAARTGPISGPAPEIAAK